MRILGYTYNADVHCKSCMLGYARRVPFAEYVWPNNTGIEDICNHNRPGIIDLLTAVEAEVIKDSEGNAIHPIFDTDEWWNTDSEASSQSLVCCDCNDIMDTVETE